jgi:hypothetical protein
VAGTHHYAWLLKSLKNSSPRLASIHAPPNLCLALRHTQHILSIMRELTAQQIHQLTAHLSWECHYFVWMISISVVKICATHMSPSEYLPPQSVTSTLWFECFLFFFFSSL